MNRPEVFSISISHNDWIQWNVIIYFIYLSYVSKYDTATLWRYAPNWKRTCDITDIVNHECTPAQTDSVILEGDVPDPSLLTSSVSLQ